MDVEPDMGADCGVGERHHDAGVTLEHGARNRLAPLGGTRSAIGGIARQGGDVERTRLGVVAGEVRRVHQHPAHDPGHTKTDDGPVVSRLAAAAGLPAIHPLAPIGEALGVPERLPIRNQVLLLGEEVVVGRDDPSAEAGRGQVHQQVVDGVAHVPSGSRPGRLPPRTMVAATLPRKRHPA